jgi:hypothetical protein
MKLNIEKFSFENGPDYLDVETHLEGWIELKIETSESFAIENQEDLDFIYQKLTEALKSVKE